MQLIVSGMLYDTFWDHKHAQLIKINILKLFLKEVSYAAFIWSVKYSKNYLK